MCSTGTTQEKEDTGLTEQSDICFNPPLYQQRYQEVARIVQEFKPKKVIDIGCGELSVVHLLKFHEGLRELVGVDIDEDTLRQRAFLIRPLPGCYLVPRPHPFSISLLHGSITDRDARLLGCDLAVCVEVIEHLYHDDLAQATDVIFGYMQPMRAIFTTPNAEFNILFPGFQGFRHDDHKFEWTRKEFQEWGNAVCATYSYTVEYSGLGTAPPGMEHLGCCTQTAFFQRACPHPVDDEPGLVDEQEKPLIYQEIAREEFPFRLQDEDLDKKILHEVQYRVRQLLKDVQVCLDETEGQFDSVSEEGDDDINWIPRWMSRKLTLTDEGGITNGEGSIAFNRHDCTSTGSAERDCQCSEVRGEPSCCNKMTDHREGFEATDATACQERIKHGVCNHERIGTKPDFENVDIGDHKSVTEIRPEQVTKCVLHSIQEAKSRAWEPAKSPSAMKENGILSGRSDGELCRMCNSTVPLTSKEEIRCSKGKDKTHISEDLYTRISTVENIDEVKVIDTKQCTTNQTLILNQEEKYSKEKRDSCRACLHEPNSNLTSLPQAVGASAALSFEKVANGPELADRECASDVTRTPTGECASDVTRTSAGECASDVTRTPTGECASDVTRTPTGECASDVTRTPTGECASDVTRTPTGECASDVTRTPTGEYASDVTRTPTGECASDVTRTPAGECASDVTRTPAGEYIIDVAACSRLLLNETKIFRPSITGVDSGMTFCAQWEKGFVVDRDYAVDELKVSIPFSRLMMCPSIRILCASGELQLREVIEASGQFRLSEDRTAIVCDLYEVEHSPFDDVDEAGGDIRPADDDDDVSNVHLGGVEWLDAQDVEEESWD